MLPAAHMLRRRLGDALVRQIVPLCRHEQAIRRLQNPELGLAQRLCVRRPRSERAEGRIDQAGQVLAVRADQRRSFLRSRGSAAIRAPGPARESGRLLAAWRLVLAPAVSRSAPGTCSGATVKAGSSLDRHTYRCRVRPYRRHAAFRR